MQSQIRYKIAKDVNFLVFADKIQTDKGYSFKNQKDKIYFEHTGNLYFLDILEKDDVFAKMKIYMPNGDIIIGWQHACWIDIHQKENFFDGRFNS